MRLLKGEFTMNENKKHKVTYYFSGTTIDHEVKDDNELRNIFKALDENRPITIVFDDEDRKILVNTRCVEAVEIEGIEE